MHRLDCHCVPNEIALPPQEQVHTLEVVPDSLLLLDYLVVMARRALCSPNCVPAMSLLNQSDLTTVFRTLVKSRLDYNNCAVHEAALKLTAINAKHGSLFCGAKFRQTASPVAAGCFWPG